MFRWIGRFFRWLFGRSSPKYALTPARASALGKAREMKQIRRRAQSSAGGRGPIRNRPAAMRLYGYRKGKSPRRRGARER